MRAGDVCDADWGRVRAGRAECQEATFRRILIQGPGCSIRGVFPCFLRRHAASKEPYTGWLAGWPEDLPARASKPACITVVFENTAWKKLAYQPRMYVYGATHCAHAGSCSGAGAPCRQPATTGQLRSSPRDASQPAMQDALSQVLQQRLSRFDTRRCHPSVVPPTQFVYPFGLIMRAGEGSEWRPLARTLLHDSTCAHMVQQTGVAALVRGRVKGS